MINNKIVIDYENYFRYCALIGLITNENRSISKLIWSLNQTLGSNFVNMNLEALNFSEKELNLSQDGGLFKAQEEVVHKVDIKKNFPIFKSKDDISDADFFLISNHFEGSTKISSKILSRYNFFLLIKNKIETDINELINMMIDKIMTIEEINYVCGLQKEMLENKIYFIF